MSMSKDRVEFTLPIYGIHNEGCRKAIYEAAYRAFGIRIKGHVIQDLHIRCRPSQFARFLIYRNELGGRNGFKDLNAKLVPAQDGDRIIDVSGRAHVEHALYHRS